MGGRRLACAVGGVLAIVLAVPSIAGAHVRIGTLAVDVRVRVLRPSQPVAFTVTVDQGSRSLRLSVQKGHRVVVLGYLGEPVLRVDGQGVSVNAASPTAAAAGLLSKRDKQGGWARRQGAAAWRDPRLQQLPAGSERARWTIPLLLDGRRVRIVGELQRVARPSLWSWLLLVLGLVAASSLLALGREQRRLRMGCIVLGGVAAAAGIITLAGFAFAADGTGMRVAAVYECLFAIGGTGFAIWGPPDMRLAASAWLGLVGLIGGFACAQIFLHGAVLSVLPETLTRTAAVLAVGSGAAAALLAGLFCLSLPDLASSSSSSS